MLKGYVSFDGRKLPVVEYQKRLDEGIKPGGKKLYEFKKLSGEGYQAAIDDAAKPAVKTADEVRETKIQALKYLLCTASAGIIEAVFFAILIKVLQPIYNDSTVYFLDPEPLDKYAFVAECISLALSVVWNFTLNRKFTFKSAKNVPLAMSLAFLFYVPFFPFAAWYVPKLSRILGAAVGTGLALTIAKGTKMLLNGVLEFMWQKFVIYRNDANTAVK